MSDTKNFEFDASNATVLKMKEVEKGKSKAEKLTGKAFDIETTADGKDVLSVTVTKTTPFQVETTVYADRDLNDSFIAEFELKVAKALPAKQTETWRFELAAGDKSFDAGDPIVGVSELGRKGWQAGRLHAGESYGVVKVGGDTLVLKTEAGRGAKLEFELFRDGDGDGLWTRFAEGETHGLWLDADGGVDLVGIAAAGLLDPADGIVS